MGPGSLILKSVYLPVGPPEGGSWEPVPAALGVSAPGLPLAAYWAVLSLFTFSPSSGLLPAPSPLPLHCLLPRATLSTVNSECNACGLLGEDTSVLARIYFWCSRCVIWAMLPRASSPALSGVKRLGIGKRAKAKREAAHVT